MKYKTRGAPQNGRVIPFPRHLLEMEPSWPQAGYWLHPEIADLIDRLIALDHSGALTEREERNVISSIAGLEVEVDHYRNFIGKLPLGRLLPDPGCRPSREAIINRPWTKENALRFLGFVHRVREYVEKLEAKYSMCEVGDVRSLRNPAH